MRVTLHIWRIWIWDTGQKDMDMKIGFFQKQEYTMWEAERQDHSITNLKSVIQPETMYM